MRLILEIPDRPALADFAAALTAIEQHLPGTRLVAEPAPPPADLFGPLPGPRPDDPDQLAFVGVVAGWSGDGKAVEVLVDAGPDGAVRAGMRVVAYTRP